MCSGRGWGGGVQGCGLAWVWLIRVSVVRMGACGLLRVYVVTSKVWPQWASVLRIGCCPNCELRAGFPGVVRGS